ncbi:MAG TPA: hypothetical protein IAB02_01535 [Candidatus Pullichristensenella excrementigallinarum]|uniref:Uncharacterized protein n=1 Tax=Candidatus Pullichristensenella excrementigallinarum TaxID=2840907 RepID=A0A9D1LBZ3_9FIRM|nr:hypothetical protein [Candidatus Pullichristensenella excrementigallinarum]
MKALKIALAVFLGALIAFAAFFWFSSSLKTEVQVVEVEAQTQQEAFDSARELLLAGLAPEVFQEEIPESSNGYTLTDVNLTLKNAGPFEAEWITWEIVPGEFDIALYSFTEPQGDLASGEETVINMKFLSRAGEDSRTVTLQYYVFGLKRTLNISC